MMTLLIRISLVLLVVLILSVIAVFVWFNDWLNTPLSFQEETVVTVVPGDNMRKLVRRFSEEKHLSHPQLFVLYARFTQQTGLKIGEYRVPAGIKPQQLLDILQSDDVISYSVTLVEGKNLEDFVAVLHRQPKIVPTLSDTSYTAIQRALNLDNLSHLEGWFFPDTYQYHTGTRDVDILLRAHHKMRKVLQEEWENRVQNLPYENAYEALIMASIVEKETGVASERPEIAGVFVRRLRKGMRLQTDPTVIYGLGDQYQGNIRKKHLRQATPYNTYVIDGLPPSPIAMPGRQAIHAALNPASGTSLFFVAKGDGSHHFSQTYREHKQAVRRYQIHKRRQDYRSSP